MSITLTAVSQGPSRPAGPVGNNATTTEVWAAFAESVRQLESVADVAIEQAQADVLLKFVSQCTKTQAMLAAIEMRAVAGYDAIVRARQWSAEVPARHIGSGVAQDLGQARRVSPSRASKYLAAARIAVRDLPQAMAQLRAGKVNAENIAAIASQVGVLGRHDRLQVDAKLGPKCGDLSRRQAEGMARALADSLDQDAALARRRQAMNQRRVTVRPAPDDMAYLTALLPLTQAVTCKAALIATAQSLVSTGATNAVGPPEPSADTATRTQNQLEADLLVELLTGQSGVSVVPTQVNLLVPAETLAGGSQPAEISTGGTGVGSAGPILIPAPEARRRMLKAHELGQATLRIATIDGSDQLVGLSQRQHFPRSLATALRELVTDDARQAADRDILEQEIRSETQHIAKLATAHERQRAIRHLTHSLAPPPSDTADHAELTKSLREAMLLSRDASPDSGQLTSAHQRALRHVQSLRRPSLHEGALASIAALRPRTGTNHGSVSPDRFARGLLRELVELRDQTCRTLYCDAPIRDIDHIIPVHAGGPTTLNNLQGLCKSCNLAKEIPR